MTTEAPAPPDRISRDGCDCPTWVERCAHFDDRRVWLVNKAVISDLAVSRGLPPQRNPRHQVLVGIREDFFEGPRGSGLLPIPGWDRDWSNLLTLDYDEASSRFAEYEERLLRGDLS